MSASYTPTLVGGVCEECKTGSMYQYQEDPEGDLRCGRCGEVKTAPGKTRATTQKKAA